MGFTRSLEAYSTVGPACPRESTPQLEQSVPRKPTQQKPTLFQPSCSPVGTLCSFPSIHPTPPHPSPFHPLFFGWRNARSKLSGDRVVFRPPSFRKTGFACTALRDVSTSPLDLFHSALRSHPFGRMQTAAFGRCETAGQPFCSRQAFRLCGALVRIHAHLVGSYAPHRGVSLCTALSFRQMSGWPSGSVEQEGELALRSFFLGTAGQPVLSLLGHRLRDAFGRIHARLGGSGTPHRGQAFCASLPF